MQDNITLKQYVSTGFLVFDMSVALKPEEVAKMHDQSVFDSLVKIGATELVRNNNSLDFELCCAMLRVYLFYIRQNPLVH